MRRYIVPFTVLVAASICFAWPKMSTTHRSTSEHVETIHAESAVQTLYYSGKIEPIILSTISAPIDATIKTVDVAYGDEVHADQVLFRLETSQDDTKSTETIVEYLKLRDESLLSEHQYNSMQALYKAGVIAKNELDESQRKRNLSAINLIKAETALAQLLPVLGMEMAAIQAVSLDDLAAINTLIICIIFWCANTAGIFLSGVKDPIIIAGVGVERQAL